MLSIKWILGVGYYLKKKRGLRRAPDDPESPDDPDSANDGDGSGYYFDLGMETGEWWGSGTPMAGLDGEVQPEHLEQICQGFGPDGKRLIQNAGASNHQQAWDLTFSVPKPLSVIWTQVPEDIRRVISEIIRRAVLAALTYLAATAILTRRGKGGKTIEPALPIVAIFDDLMSRELDPQLHSHCVLVNVAGRADGTFGTILSEPFYRHKRTAGALFQAELAHGVVSELGLKIAPDGMSFRLVGMPQNLVEHHSKRRKQIEKMLRAKGHHSAKAAAVAALDTRKPKPERMPTRTEFIKRCQETNAEFGFTTEKALGLLGRVAPRTTPLNLKKQITEAMEELLEEESVFAEQQLIRQTAGKIIAHGIQAQEIINQVRGFIRDNPELIPLQPRKHEPFFATRETLEVEKGISTAIEEGRNDAFHAVKEEIVQPILDKELPLKTGLSDDELARNREQRQAVTQITAMPGQFQGFEGMAGTGKGYAVKVAHRIWSKAGFQVIGMALSAVAAGNLQRSTGIESDTVAMRLAQLDRKKQFAFHHKRQLRRLVRGKRTYAYRGPQLRLTRKTIVVLDEAGMVGTKQMAQIVKHVKNSGAKLVFIGDRRQLPPIEAGGPFASMTDQTDKAVLNHVVRQKVEPHDPEPMWHRQAGKDIAAGDVAKGFKKFAERGRLTVANDREAAMLGVLRDWSVAGESDPLSHIILAGLRAEVQVLNEACQSARLAAGYLKNGHVKIGQTKLHVGDIVLFAKNSRLFGVNNGDRGVVLGFNRLTKTISIQLERTRRPVYISYRDYHDIELGYALTTHKAQGLTVPSVYVLLGGPMQDRHLTYVQLSRAAESTRLYVDSFSAGPELRHLLNQISKKRPKLLAHDLLEKEEPEAKPKKVAKGMPQDTPPTPTGGQPSGRKKKWKPRTKAPKTNKSSQDVEAITMPAEPAPPVNSQASGVASEVITPTSTPQESTPTRDLRNLSHVKATSTTDVSFLQATIRRYGKLPGGIVVEGHARCDIPIKSLKIDAARPTVLIVNDSHVFDTGLSAEEVALLWHAVLETGEAAKDFGVLSQRRALGIDQGNLVAHMMMTADDALSGTVYGYDSQHSLGNPPTPFSHNPFAKETELAAEKPEVVKRLIFNYVLRLYPQIVLTLKDVNFAAKKDGILQVRATSIVAAIGVLKGEGTLTTSTTGDSLAPSAFPFVHQAFDELVENFGDYAAANLAVARTVAYGELVALLRLAKSANAKIIGHEHVQALVANRRQYPIPQFNYTLRSKEFAALAAGAAKRLLRNNSHWFDGLMASVVALNYATLAGEWPLFRACRDKALKIIDHIQEETFYGEYAELTRMLPDLKERVCDTCHDTLILQCLNAACEGGVSREDKEAYLKDALRLCEPAIESDKTSAVLCHSIEAKSYLDPSYDPLPELAKARRHDPSSMQAYYTLSRIKKNRKNPVGACGAPRELSLTIRERKAQLGFSKLKAQLVAIWKALEAHKSEQETLWLLDEIQRLGLPDEECLAAARTHKDPRQALWLLLVARLKPLPATSFSTGLLHRNNPFVTSHELLDHETPENLAELMSSVRLGIEPSFTSSRHKKLSLRFLLSAFAPLDAGQWWRSFLRSQARSPENDSSKVALLLLHELKARKSTVEQLCRQMQKHRTNNPQAALFLLDLEHQWLTARPAETR